RAYIRGNTNTGPSADSGKNGDILLSIGTNVCHRIADDSGWCFELPQDFARLGIYGFEPSLHGSVEDHVASGSESPSPVRQTFFDSPHFLACRGIPGDEFASMATGTGMTHDDGANVRLSGLVFHLHALVVHAQVVGGNVEEVCSGRIRNRLLVLAS